MFLGHFRHQVDAKGRVAVPAQFRRGLPPGSVVSHGPEGRLVIRPPQEWAELERRYSLTAESGPEERAFLRALYASARPLELDAQGRMLLDAGHRRWAQIEDRAVFVGLGSCVEIVGERIWDSETAALDQAAFTALNDRVMARAAEASGGSSGTP